MPPASTHRDTPRRGVWMFPGVAAGAIVVAIVAADELGLDEVWIADEGVARDPVPMLSAAAGCTRRIRLAIGVTSPVLRHPGAIAASTATLDELSGGRAVVGLGVGGDLALGPFGLRSERPVGLLDDAIETVRAVHARRATDHYEPPPHAMPARRIPIWVGARGPQLVRLAARAADGLFLSGCSPDQQESIIETASSVGTVATAIYQTAVDAPSSPSEAGWDDAHQRLADAVDRHAPASIGINLVQLADAASEPLALVERAAQLLAEV